MRCSDVQWIRTTRSGNRRVPRCAGPASQAALLATGDLSGHRIALVHAGISPPLGEYRDRDMRATSSAALRSFRLSCCNDQERHTRFPVIHDRPSSQQLRRTQEGPAGVNEMWPPFRSIHPVMAGCSLCQLVPRVARDDGYGPCHRSVTLYPSTRSQHVC